MWRPKVEMPARMPHMASSQIPPVASMRAPGFVAALYQPSGNPCPMALTLVEPYRSAEAVSKAPLLAWL